MRVFVKCAPPKNAVISNGSDGLKVTDAAVASMPAGNVPDQYAKPRLDSGVAVTVTGVSHLNQAVPDGETAPKSPATIVPTTNLDHCHSSLRNAAGVGWV